MAKVRHSRFDCAPGCSVEAAIGLIDGKWKSIVLFHLLSGTLRFNEIRRHIAGVTPRMLTNQLRELEEDGLITRKVYAQVPPKVEYSLSPLGRSMEPILLALKSWGDANINLYGKPHARKGDCAGLNGLHSSSVRPARDRPAKLRSDHIESGGEHGSNEPRD